MLLDFPESTRAPGRGRYERGCSGLSRFRAQRERLLRATAIAHLEGSASVTRVAALSGVGRSTFYECFDDFEHALGATRREELQRFRRGLIGLHEGEARSENVTLLCRAWMELIAARPVNALAALESPRGEQRSPLVSVFAEALVRMGSSLEARELKAALSHAAACAEASGRSLALGLLGSSRVASMSVPGRASAGDDSVVGEAALALARSVWRLLMGA
jgi:AcrR family transcriptional regulator